MSYTPRTDALVEANRGKPCSQAIDADVVRQLERELTAANQKLKVDESAFANVMIELRAAQEELTRIKSAEAELPEPPEFIGLKVPMGDYNGFIVPISLIAYLLNVREVAIAQTARVKELEATHKMVFEQSDGTKLSVHELCNMKQRVEKAEAERDAAVKALRLMTSRVTAMLDAAASHMPRQVRAEWHDEWKKNLDAAIKVEGEKHD